MEFLFTCSTWSYGIPVRKLMASDENVSKERAKARSNIHTSVKSKGNCICNTRPSFLNVQIRVDNIQGQWRLALKRSYPVKYNECGMS